MRNTPTLLGTFPLVALAACSLSSGASAALIGINTIGNADEQAALISTLTTFGHTTTGTIDSSVDLVISYPGGSASAVVGVPYLQISDHGAGQIANSWSGITEGSTVTINLDGVHPILTNVDASWNTLGFWRYGFASEDFLGYATAIPGLADATANATNYNEVLAVSGTNSIFIGWNVYGADATSNDLKVLGNSIEFLTTGVVTPEPSSTLLLGLAGLAVSVMRRRK